MSTPAIFSTPGLRAFAEEVDAERQRQLAKWGVQRLPDGTGTRLDREMADRARLQCDQAAEAGGATWGLVLIEEVREAMAEKDRVRLRKELIEVAAVCASWIFDLDKRTAEEDHQ